MKPNNYIVWQHQTEQLHFVTTPNRTITLYDNTKPNNYIVWQHVRTWNYDKRILPKIMCPQQEEKVVWGGGWKSCVTPGQTKITQVANYETKQLHCMTTPNQTITLHDNTKPNNYIVWQHVRTWYYDKMILPKIMCPHPLQGPLGQEKKVALERGWWKSCVTRGQQKLYKL